MIRLCFLFCFMASLALGETFSDLVLKGRIKEPYMIELSKKIEEIEVTLDEEKMVDIEAILKDYSSKEPDNFLWLYLLSRIHFSFVNLFENVKVDDEKAKEYLEKALDDAKMAIKLESNFSDSYRIAADIYGRLIGFKPPMIYGPIYGPRASKLIKKALELDPNNPEVYLAQGRSYLFTPRVFGGSKKKAIECFKKVSDILPGYHWSYVWQGQAYLKMGRKNEAKEAFEKALSLEPKNFWARHEIERLGGGDFR
ncbi:TPA: hypothetical protein DCX16_01470 [bacterium]|nr:hypothetical protein [bacterium]